MEKGLKHTSFACAEQLRIVMTRLAKYGATRMSLSLCG